MSHSPITFSPPLTPLLDRSVGELVAERPGRSRIFQAHGIDFCCQGSRTVREACKQKGVSTSTLGIELQKELEEQMDPGENPANLQPHELCEYIVEKHHAFLRNELPRLHAMSERVARVHGNHTPSLIEVFKVFRNLANALASHITKEEQALFPAVSAMSRNDVSPVLLERPITMMIEEHDEAGVALSRLRELTDDFTPPASACNTYRALFAGLRDLEEDLHRHIRLENSVLFPAARELASRASG